jgi:uncharacterized protein
MNRPVHFEILSDDPQATADFYRRVFKWESAAWEGQEYWLLTTGAAESPGIDGGIMRRHFPQPVINTITVDSLDETLAQVEAAGGRKVHGPSEVPGVGMHVYCADPDGTLFGVMQPHATGVDSSEGP